jgi:hypothetical protein
MGDRSQPTSDAFSRELSDAIERTSADMQGAFMHDGANLVHAAEREAFARLVNDPGLARAYIERGGVVSVLDAYEAHIVAELVPGTRTEVSLARRVRTSARPVVRRLRSQLPRPRATAPTIRPIWLVTHHPKFVRFAEPLIDAIGSSHVGVLALSPLAFAAVPTDVAALLITPRPSGGSSRGGRPHLRDLFDAVRHELDRQGARVAIVFEGNAPGDEVAGAAARAAGIASLCLQHGWAPASNVGFRNMTHTSMAVWGEGFAELLRPDNPNQSFVVTGNLTLDAHGAGGPLTDRVGRSRGILFSLQTVAPTISLTAMQEFVELIAAGAARLPDVQIIVREHPGHALSALGIAVPEAPNIVVAHPTDVTLADALDASFAVASISSTTLLEGVATLRPALIVDTHRYRPDIEAWGAGLQPSGRDAALDALVRLSDPAARATFEPGMHAFRDHFFAGEPGGAAERLSAVVREMV